MFEDPCQVATGASGAVFRWHGGLICGGHGDGLRAYPKTHSKVDISVGVSELLCVPSALQRSRGLARFAYWRIPVRHISFISFS